MALPALGHGFAHVPVRGYAVPLGPVGYPLPAYADGGYPLVYLDSRDRCLCARCANDPDCEYGPAVLCDVHWEGQPLECDACGYGTASAYGDPHPEIADERSPRGRL